MRKTRSPMPQLIVIAAMTRARVIGGPGGLPWNIPEEYQQFLDWVRGSTVIMGRRSYEIFAGDLGDTNLVVLTRSAMPRAGIVVAGSIEEALAKGSALGRTVFSAGGASIYRQTVPLADAMYLSYIEGDYAGDAYFPEFDEADWHIERRDVHPRFTFVIYRRIRPPRPLPQWER
jgi:dihydrofolate reductase